MSALFVGYRRSDAGGHARLIYDGLARHFGSEQVFIDVEKMRPGDEFASVLEETLEHCSALVAVIGPDWAGAGEPGQRRIDAETDFVRLEISKALEHGVKVFPVLVGGARMPAADELPEDIRAITGQHAHEITELRFDYDLGNLVRELEGLAVPRWRRRRRIVLAAAGGTVIALGAAAIAFAFVGGTDDDECASEATITHEDVSTPITPRDVDEVLANYEAAYSTRDSGSLETLFAKSFTRKHGDDPLQNEQDALAEYETQFSGLTDPCYTLEGAGINLTGPRAAEAEARYEIVDGGDLAGSGGIEFSFLTDDDRLLIDHIRISPDR